MLLYLSPSSMIIITIHDISQVANYGYIPIFGAAVLYELKFTTLITKEQRDFPWWKFFIMVCLPSSSFPFPSLISLCPHFLHVLISFASLPIAITISPPHPISPSHHHQPQQSESWCSWLVGDVDGLCLTMVHREHWMRSAGILWSLVAWAPPAPCSSSSTRYDPLLPLLPSPFSLPSFSLPSLSLSPSPSFPSLLPSPPCSLLLL